MISERAGERSWRGGLFVVLALGLFACSEGPSELPMTIRWGGRVKAVWTMVAREDGGLLVGGPRGLWVLPPADSKDLAPGFVLRNQAVHGLALREEGGYWVAASEGLYVYGNGVATRQAGPGAEAGRPLCSLSARRGELVVGTPRGAWILRGRCWERLRDTHSTTVLPVLALCHGPTGLAVGKDGALIHRDLAGRYHLHRRESFYADRSLGLPSNRVQALAAESDGFWVGTDRGLARLRGEGFVYLKDLPRELALGDVQALARTANALWVAVGGAEPGLWQYIDRRWYRRRDPGGLDYGVTALAPAVDGVAVATGQGILRLRGSTLRHWPLGGGLEAGSLVGLAVGARGRCAVVQGRRFMVWSADGEGLEAIRSLDCPEAVDLALPGNVAQILAGDGAMYRLDGTSWRRLRAPRTTGDRALAFCHSGSVTWISWAGGGLERIDGQTSRWIETEGATPILHMAGDGLGGVWLCSPGGRSSLRHRDGQGRLLHEESGSHRGLAAHPGGIWVLKEREVEGRSPAGTSIRRIPLPSPIEGRASFIRARADGVFCCGGVDTGLWFWHDGKWAWARFGEGDRHFTPSLGAFSAQGLWVGTPRSGLAELREVASP